MSLYDINVLFLASPKPPPSLILHQLICTDTKTIPRHIIKLDR